MRVKNIRTGKYLHLQTQEAVNHPAHYGGGDNPHEHVKCAEAIGLDRHAHLYNATKYIWRAGKKGSRLEDLRKAAWYLAREIQNEERLAREELMGKLERENARG